MNIHFAALVDGDKDAYQVIVNAIRKLGHKIVTTHYLTQTIEGIENETPQEAEKFFKNVKRWMKKADILVYEITKNDINSGHEISQAISMKKPVIMLYKKDSGSMPYSFKGANSEYIQIIEYTEDKIDYFISEALSYAEQLLNIRFNLILTPNEHNYLEKMAKKLFTSKAAIIRKLINKKMTEDGYISNDELAPTSQIE